jgi:hypothetical protein
MTNPASPYLLDRLQARRAHPNTRSRRSDSVARLTGPDDDLFLDEARSSGNDNLSTTPNNTNNPTNTNASLGVREIEKRMDKLSKLNFDLKLELFHCRERMAKLQENCNLLASRADDANRLVEENATLLELNDSLVKELERRDEAVQEAVSIICNLEERLEQAQYSQRDPHDRLGTPTKPRASSVSPCPRDILSPPKSDKSSLTRSTSARRIPSFVDDKKPSTRALRSVYLDPKPTLHAVKSFASLTSQAEDVDKSVSDADTLDSPRLSVLSKSSFPSIYNLRRTHLLFPTASYTISHEMLAASMILTVMSILGFKCKHLSHPSSLQKKAYHNRVQMLVTSDQHTILHPLKPTKSGRRHSRVQHSAEPRYLQHRTVQAQAFYKTHT